MTIEVFEPTPLYLIKGTGPYAILHPYDRGAIVASIVTTRQVIPLDLDDYTMTPEAGAARGDLFLSDIAAALHDGQRLLIERLTTDEQGWQGLLGERERGLERQMDIHTMAIQEVRRQAGLSLKSVTPLPPIVPENGRVLMFDDEAIVGGPTARQIEEAENYAGQADQSAAWAALSAAAATKAAEDTAGLVPIDPRSFGASGDGLNDDTAAVSAAFSVGGVIKFKRGIYRVSQLAIPLDNTTIELTEGAVLFLDGPANEAGLTTLGAAGPQRLMTVNGLRGDRNITIEDATGIAPGDMLRVYSTAKVQFNQPMAGELQYVRSVSGNVITLQDGLFANYLMSDTAAIRKITPRKNITIQGAGEIRGNGTQRNLIEFNFSENVQVKGITIRNGYTAAISFRTVAHWRVADCFIKDTLSPDQGYGVVLEECVQWGSMTGCTVTNAGTGFDIGGSSTRFGHSRFWSVIGNSFYGCHRRGISTHEAGPNGIIAFNHVQCRAGIEGDAGRGIWTRSGDIIIMGNTVMNASGPTAESAAIQVTVRSYDSGAQVIGNQVLYSRIQGIRLDISGDGSQNATLRELIVSGNIVRDGGTQGIYVQTGGIPGETYARDWDSISITDNTVNGQPGAALIINLLKQGIKSFTLSNNRFTVPLSQECVLIASDAGTIKSFLATSNYLRGNRGFRATSATPVPPGNGWFVGNFIDHVTGAFTFIDAGDRANNKERLAA